MKRSKKIKVLVSNLLPIVSIMNDTKVSFPNERYQSIDMNDLFEPKTN